MSETLTINPITITVPSSPLTVSEQPPLSPSISASSNNVNSVMPPPIPANYQPQLSPSSPLPSSPLQSPLTPTSSPPSIPSSPAPATILTPEEIDAKKSLDRFNRRTQIIKEIKSTERDYTANINRIVSDYIAPLRLSPDKFGINNEHISTIFKNIDVIAGFHTILNTDIMECDSALTICQCLLKRADFLQFYSDYINNFETASKLLGNLLKENKKFTKFLSDKRAESTNGLDLASLLIMPVQRIPRYELLLKELKRNLDPVNNNNDTTNTSSLSEEMIVLDKALLKIVTNAQNVNEKKRKFERESALELIQKKISNLDLIFPSGINNSNSDHRRLIKEGILKAKKSTFGMKVRYCYLLNDVFIITSDKKYKSHFGVYELLTSNYNNHQNGEEKENNSSSSDKEELGIELSHPACKSMILYAESQYEQKQWLNCFNEAHKEAQNFNTEINAAFRIQTNNNNHNNNHSSTQSRHDRTISVSSLNNSNLSVYPHDSHSPLSPRSPHPAMEDVEEEETNILHDANVFDHEDNNSNLLMNKEEEKEIDENILLNSKNHSNIILKEEKESLHSRNTSSSSTSSKIINKSVSHSRVSSTIVTPRGVSTPVTNTRKIINTGTGNKSRTHSRKPSNANVSEFNHNTINNNVDKEIVNNKNEIPVIKDIDTTTIPTLTMLTTTTNPSTTQNFSLNNKTPIINKSLSSLSRNDVTSLKKMKNPPIPVKLAIESLAILLDLPPGEPQRGDKKPNYWQPVQALLVKPTFLKDLLNFEIENKQVSAEGLITLKSYIYNEQLKPELVSSCSQPTGILWNWIRSRYQTQTGEELPFNEIIQNKEKKLPITSKINSGIKSIISKSQSTSRTVSRKVTPSHTRQSSIASTPITSTKSLLSSTTPSRTHSRRVSKIDNEIKVSSPKNSNSHSINSIKPIAINNINNNSSNTARGIKPKPSSTVTTPRIPVVSAATPRIKLNSSVSTAAVAKIVNKAITKTPVTTAATSKETK